MTATKLSGDSIWQLQRCRRQYLQLLPKLNFPVNEYLREQPFQQALFEQLFRDGALQYPPPRRYQLHVLKELTQTIENSITDWEEHDVSEDLMNSLSSLLTASIPSEVVSIQQKSYVTYSLSLLSPQDPPTITLLEARNLVAAAGTTGMRTWEAALHLGNYLSTQQEDLIDGKSVLELGTGTGYISILCAKHLGAAYVLATDGSEDVVSGLSTNLLLNGLQNTSKIQTKELRWGHVLASGEQLEWNGGRKVDVVLGADITYDESGIVPLVATFEDLLQLFPDVKIIISATIRNRRTFKAFVNICRSHGYQVEEIDFATTPAKEQMGPFSSDAVPIKICTINKS